MSSRVEYTVGHLFAGLGGGALGAERGRAAIGRVEARFRTVGGVDMDAGACEDFERLVGAPCLRADVHTLTPAELKASWQTDRLDALVSSPPCKGFSRLLPKKQAVLPKYRRMNELALVGMNLVLACWTPRLIFIENVAGIMSRGHDMLIKLRALLAAHGYRTAEGMHNCGEVGELAQNRVRWFLVARHEQSLPRVVYLPPKRRVRACGEVLGRLPIPLGDGAGGRMHAMPRIHAITWARLAMIPPGGDWRDLPQPACDGSPIPLGRTADEAESFGGRPGLLGVVDGRGPAPTMTGGMQVAAGNTPSAIADPRVAAHGIGRGYTCNYQVAAWPGPTRTATAASRPGSGALSVGDPRLSKSCESWSGAMGVKDWESPSAAITASGDVQNGQGAVGDPRPWWRGSYGMLRWDGPSGAVTGGAAPSRGAFSVADPRVRFGLGALDDLLDGDVKQAPKEMPIIVGPWGTWNRPLTTLEIAVIMGFDERLGGSWLELSGRSSTAWRQRLGNAIPPPAMRSVADQLLRAMLGADLDAMAELELDPAWVAPHLHGGVVA